MPAAEDCRYSVCEKICWGVLYGSAILVVVGKAVIWALG